MHKDGQMFFSSSLKRKVFIKGDLFANRLIYIQNNRIQLMTSNTLKFIDKFREVKNLEIIESQSDIKRLSKDFYNYSPILTEKLDECIADLVVRPSDHKAVKEVAKFVGNFLSHLL